MPVRPEPRRIRETPIESANFLAAWIAKQRLAALSPVGMRQVVLNAREGHCPRFPPSALIDVHPVGMSRRG